MLFHILLPEKYFCSMLTTFLCHSDWFTFTTKLFFDLVFVISRAVIEGFLKQLWIDALLSQIKFTTTIWLFADEVFAIF